MNKLNRLNFLGLELINSDLISVYNDVIYFLNQNSNQVKYLFTPNPEMFVEISKNSKFFYVLKSAEWLLPDGIGIKIWAKIFDLNFSSRLTGIDFFEYFLNDNSVKYRTFLLGGASGAAKSISKNDKIVGFYDEQVDAFSSSEIVKNINNSNAEVVFVALGAPKQELWIDEYSSLCPNVKLWVGVGGAFDFVAGLQKRAPKIFRLLGLEWLFRLYMEPKRLHRIFNAVFVFSFLCVKNFVICKFKSKRI